MSGQKSIEIPVINFEALHPESSQRQEESRRLGQGLVDYGFFALEGHPVPQKLQDEAYSLAAEFFTKDEEYKRKFILDGINGQRGYTAFGQENAKGSSVPDLKEFWHVGRSHFTQETTRMKYPQNVWPEIEGFKATFQELYGLLEKTSIRLLQSCAIFLGEEENLFSDMTVDGDSLMRLLYYPPLAEGRDPSSIRAAAHEDINFITILSDSTSSGLELLDRQGNWHAVTSHRGQLVVDSADMLQNLTNGILKSTTHRVVNPDNSKDARFSMPFFVHPRPECSLNPLASCINKVGEVRYPNRTVGEYLEERLREIGLM